MLDLLTLPVICIPRQSRTYSFNRNDVELIGFKFLVLPTALIRSENLNICKDWDLLLFDDSRTHGLGIDWRSWSPDTESGPNWPGSSVQIIIINCWHFLPPHLHTALPLVSRLGLDPRLVLRYLLLTVIWTLSTCLLTVSACSYPIKLEVYVLPGDSIFPWRPHHITLHLTRVLAPPSDGNIICYSLKTD